MLARIVTKNIVFTVLAVLAIISQHAIAQTKINLATQVQGVLPAANGGYGVPQNTPQGYFLGSSGSDVTPPSYQGFTASGTGAVTEPWNTAVDRTVHAASYGFSAVASAANNRIYFNAAAAAALAAKLPLVVDPGIYAFDNSTPYAVVSNLIVRGYSHQGQTTGGTIFVPTTAKSLFTATGDYIAYWELTGFTVDYTTVSGCQNNAQCIGIAVSGGVSQGASQFSINDVTILSPYIGFSDTSSVSFGYTINNIQVVNPGSKGIAIDGGGTSKVLNHPVINGTSAYNNDGIYINGQTNQIAIYNPIFDALVGRYLNVVSSNLNLYGGYFEHITPNYSSGNVLIFNNSNVLIDGLVENGAQLSLAGSSVILVQSSSHVQLNNFVQKGQGIIGSIVVYGLNVDSTSTVTVNNSSSIRTKMQQNSGSSVTITDPSGNVKIIEKTYRNRTSVSTSGSGEKVMMTYTLPGSTINDGGSIRVTAAGVCTNANGNKEIVFHLGSKAIVLMTAVNSTNNWHLELYVTATTSTAAQSYEWKFWDGATLHSSYDTSTQDTNSDLTLSVTGNPSNASDIVTQNLLLVETL